MEAVRKRFTAIGKKNRWVRFLGPNVDRWLSDLDEVIDGLGDGAVAVKRGRLEGVKDVLVLQFDHGEILSAEPTKAVEKARAEMLKRLMLVGAKTQSP